MCIELAFVGIFVVMCLTFVTVILGPLWMLDRADRRIEQRVDND